MKRFMKENKLLSVIIGFLFTSIITYNVLWGTWVTNQIFCQAEKISSHESAQKEETKSVSKQVEEVKSEIKSLKEEVKEDGIRLRKDIVDNQKELLKLLIDIKRNNKK